MDNQSRVKVINAGFTILHADMIPPIKIQCLRPGSKRFETWQRFDTIKNRDKRLRELLKEPKFILD